VFINDPRTEEQAAGRDGSAWNAVAAFEKATSNGPSIAALSDDPDDKPIELPPHLRDLLTA
jgi:hypothetical protein